MGGLSSLRKGKQNEREVKNLLQAAVDSVAVDYPELTAPSLQRNTLQSAIGGYDIVGIDWLALEVKAHATLNVNSWWKQTVQQAGPGQLPVLAYKITRRGWWVVTEMQLPVADKTFKCRAEITMESFLVYFKARVRADFEAQRAAKDQTVVSGA